MKKYYVLDYYNSSRKPPSVSVRLTKLYSSGREKGHSKIPSVNRARHPQDSAR